MIRHGSCCGIGDGHHLEVLDETISCGFFLLFAAGVNAAERGGETPQLAAKRFQNAIAA